MEIMKEEDILKAYNSFIDELIDQLNELGSIIEIKSKSLKLVLDNKLISNEKDINSTNGRYFFKNKEYKDCYYPHSNLPGVYLFFNENNEAVYVGKSEDAVGNRIWSHIGSNIDGNFPHLKFKESEYIIVIPFKESSSLAVAFESYLLSKYKFKYNTIFNR